MILDMFRQVRKYGLIKENRAIRAKRMKMTVYFFRLPRSILDIFSFTAKDNWFSFMLANPISSIQAI
jgi:hypothetical protein